MPVSGSQLSSGKRPQWFHVTMGFFLIVVAVALTLGWQFLASEQARANASSRRCASWSTSSACSCSCC